MPLAARVGDSTSHGIPLSPGPASPNVIIGGRPAWRATSDFHSCPLMEEGKPHVGGVVLIGSTTVFINNLPAVRVGDIIGEFQPSTITSGCSTVIIG